MLSKQVENCGLLWEAEKVSDAKAGELSHSISQRIQDGNDLSRSG